MTKFRKHSIEEKRKRSKNRKLREKMARGNSASLSHPSVSEGGVDLKAVGELPKDPPMKPESCKSADGRTFQNAVTSEDKEHLDV